MNLKRVIKPYILFLYNFFRKKEIRINNDLVTGLKIFRNKKRNLFFGYYDLKQTNSKLITLAMELPNNPVKGQSIADIGIIDKDGAFKKFAETSAWSWQQGSRLRWNPANNDEIVYNDFSDNRFFSVFFNIKNGEKHRLDYPLYDINSDGTLGALCDFVRLDRLRPGYGYSNVVDKTKGLSAPGDNGLWLVNIPNNTCELLISLEDLAKKVDPNFIYEHYINHISFSPDSANIMFFHVWNCPMYYGWMTNLCIYNLEKKEVKILEDTMLVSHYAWRNNRELLVTTKDSSKIKYVIYNLYDNSKRILEYCAHEDGHPSFINEDVFISDTYPNRALEQKVFIFDLKSNSLINLVSVSSSPFCQGEKRCDLHPRVMGCNVIFDTTHFGKQRSMIAFTLNQ